MGNSCCTDQKTNEVEVSKKPEQVTLGESIVSNSNTLQAAHMDKSKMEVLEKSKMELNQSPGTISEDHAPPPESEIIQVSDEEMNRMARVVAGIVEKSGFPDKTDWFYNFSYSINPEKPLLDKTQSAEFPVLGPYKYPNQVTYHGQYRFGKRQGIGIF